MKSTVSSKGQVTIPMEVRQRLGLRTGTPVVFELGPRGVLLRRAAAGEHPVDKLFGSLRMAVSVDASLDASRGPRPKGAGARRRRG